MAGVAGGLVSGGGVSGLLRRKGPELLLEAAFVVFAVLVALGVDQWNEGRELRVRVERAQSAVEAELRSNQREVEVGSRSLQEMFVAVASMVDRMRAGEELTEGNLGAEIPDFSDAAWETARVTGTVSYMDYTRVLEIARVYETQDQALEVQNRLLATVGGLSARGLEQDLLVELQGQLFIALQMYGNLAGKYEELLGAQEEEGGGS